MSTSGINSAYVPKSFLNSETGDLKVDQKLADQVQAGVMGAIKDMPEAEKAKFLDMVAGLAPEQVDTQIELDIVLSVFKGAAEAIGSSSSPAAAFVGDVAKFLARAMMEQASHERKNALEGRLAAREQAAAQSMEQSEKLNDAADKMMAGAMTNMIIGIVASAVSALASGVSAVGSLGGALKLGGIGSALKGSGATTLTAAQDITKSVTTGVVDGLNALSKVATSLSDMSRSIGTGIDGKMQAEAKKMEADAQIDAAQSQYSQQTGDMKKEIQDNMKELMERIINFVKEMQDAEVDAMRAITMKG